MNTNLSSEKPEGIKSRESAKLGENVNEHKICKITILMFSGDHK